MTGKEEKPGFLGYALRIAALAGEYNQPINETIGERLDLLVCQLKEDVKRIREMGWGSVIEAGNFRLTWLNREACMLEIFDKCPIYRDAKLVESHRISFREAE